MFEMTVSGVSQGEGGMSVRLPRTHDEGKGSSNGVGKRALLSPQEGQETCMSAPSSKRTSDALYGGHACRKSRRPVPTPIGVCPAKAHS